MNIVCVAACTAGIAHTYIAREKLIKGAKALGHTIKAVSYTHLEYSLSQGWFTKCVIGLSTPIASRKSR